MKRALILYVLIITVGTVVAQTKQSEVISTAGGTINVTNYTFSYTIGEVAIGETVTDAYSFQRGFQQGNRAQDGFEEPIYVWSETNDSLIATAINEQNVANSIIEKVATTYIDVTLPTCTTTGTRQYSAVLNNKLFSNQTKTITTDSLGHQWSEGEIETIATCSATGTMRYTCLHDANHTKTETISIDTAAHAWGDWVVTTASTETTIGIETRTCQHNAAHTQTRATLPYNHEHTFTHVDATSPTCESEGNVEYYKCSGCNRYYADNEANVELTTVTTPALGHSWNEGVITLAATCEAEGEKTYTCQHDNSHTKIEKIPALGHSWNEGVITLAATCEAEGEKTYTCAHNAAHIYKEILSALGHNWGAWAQVKKAAATEAGEEQRICQNDTSHVQTRIISPYGEPTNQGAMQGWISWIESGGNATIEKQEEGSCIKLNVTAADENWTAQFTSPSWQNLYNQTYDPENPVSFTIIFDAKFVSSDSSTSVISMATGVTSPYQEDFQKDNTQLIDVNGKPLVWLPEQTVGSEWKTYQYTGFIGEQGADSIRMQFFAGTEVGEMYIGNIYIVIGEDTVASYFINKPTETIIPENPPINPPVNPNAISEQIINDIQVYPNPTHSLLYIDFSNENTSGTLCCYDAVGRQIMTLSFNSEKQLCINLTSLPQGNYTIEIDANNKIIMKKIMKF